MNLIILNFRVGDIIHCPPFTENIQGDQLTVLKKNTHGNFLPPQLKDSNFQSPFKLIAHLGLLIHVEKVLF